LVSGHTYDNTKSPPPSKKKKKCKLTLAKQNKNIAVVNVANEKQLIIFVGKDDIFSYLCN
jgi:hypothetical protein